MGQQCWLKSLAHYFNSSMKFSALNIVFASLNFGPRIQGILHMGASDLGTSSKCVLSVAETAAATRDQLHHLAYVTENDRVQCQLLDR